MIPVSVLMFDIDLEPSFDPGRAPGSSLRGALYAALRTMYDSNQLVASRDAYDDNPVGWLLRLEDAESSGGKDVPRPIAVRPFLESTPNTFGLAFYGQAIQAVPMVVSAIPTMGRIGVGKRRYKFTLQGVRALDPLTGQSQTLLDSSGQIVNKPLDPPDSISFGRLSAMLAQDTLKMSFLTPTRIVRHGRLSHQPVFRAWFQRLLERIRLISEVYMDEPIWMPFRELLAQADDVRIVQDNTRWHESWSGSRRDGMVKPLGGFVGTVHYEGDLSQLLPFILLGQSLQVGKNTMKGCGWYEITFQWAT